MSAKKEKRNTATVNPVEEENEGDIALFGSGVQTEVDPVNLPKNAIGSSSLGFDQLRGGANIFKRAGDSIDEKTGLIEWQLKLKAKDNQTFDYDFKIRHPKDKIVQI